MPVPLDVELVQESQRRAQLEIIDTIRALYELNVGPNGETFGSQHMSREDRILAFLEDARSGALDNLFVIKREFGEAYVKQYREDVSSSPVLRVPGHDRAVDRAARAMAEQFGGY